MFEKGKIGPEKGPRGAQQYLRYFCCFVCRFLSYLSVEPSPQVVHLVSAPASRYGHLPYGVRSSCALQTTAKERRQKQQKPKEA